RKINPPLLSYSQDHTFTSIIPLMKKNKPQSSPVLLLPKLTLIKLFDAVSHFINFFPGLPSPRNQNNTSNH
ncbi:MAG: hypothetical protein ACK5DG_04605, partial [Chitinophagaceae bacterium]